MRRLGILGSVFLSACVAAAGAPGCSGGAADEAQDGAAAPVDAAPARAASPDAEAATGWATVDGRGHFSFSLPPEFEHEKTWGDEHVKEQFGSKYVAETMWVGFDYGSISGALDCPQPDFFDVCKEDWVKIDGRRARLVRAHRKPDEPGEPYFTVVYFPSADHVEPELSVFAYFNDPEQQRLATRIFRTIRFPG